MPSPRVQREVIEFAQGKSKKMELASLRTGGDGSAGSIGLGSLLQKKKFFPLLELPGKPEGAVISYGRRQLGKGHCEGDNKRKFTCNSE